VAAIGRDIIAALGDQKVARCSPTMSLSQE
jgi:hypothetical protein